MSSNPQNEPASAEEATADLYRRLFPSQESGMMILLAQLLFLMVLTSCHSLPSHHEVLARVNNEKLLTVHNEKGTLSPLEARHELAVAAGGKADLNWLHDLALGEQNLTNRPLYAGNRIELLVDGPETFRAIFAEIREARHHIHIETFIFRDDEIGQLMSELLIQKARQGVQVRVIYDSFGSTMATPAFFDRMREGGVEVHEFRPFNMITMVPVWHSHMRHHRKLFVMDGRVAFVGGLNITRVYRRSAAEPPAKPMIDDRWRDTHVRIRGPVVSDLQRVFIDMWNELHQDGSGKVIDDGQAGYFPPLEREGNSLVRVIYSFGGTDTYEVYDSHVHAFAKARQRIYITQGYFAPNPEFLAILREAREEREVDVELLLPGFTDVWITFHSSQGTYNTLMDANVRLYERRDALLHAKTAIVDNVWSTVGSANMDYRSFAHNNEMNIVVYDHEFVQDLEVLHEFDREQMHELTPQEWSERPFSHKMMEWLGSLVRYWL